MERKFIESICFKGGGFQNLPLHQKRVNRTFSSFFSTKQPFILDEILPQVPVEETHKVRVVYSDEKWEVSNAAYQARSIQSIALAEAPFFDYSFKFKDRSRINQLLGDSGTDEIIICMDGMITDSSYSNLAFWDGGQWLTPSTPLLEGVKRAQLLAEGSIKKAPITIHDIGAFEKVSLINAMMDLGELEFPVSAIL